MSQSTDHEQGPNNNFTFDWGESDMETSLEDLNIGDLGAQIEGSDIPKLTDITQTTK